jgi:hypothetical protein
MITEFCMSCGAKFEYSLKKPKFCSSCGEPLVKEKSEGSVAKESQSKEQEETLPSISKLEYSIAKNNNRMTFGELLSEGQESSTSYEKMPSRPRPKHDPSEDVVQTTMQQCRSRKEPEDTGASE